MKKEQKIKKHIHQKYQTHQNFIYSPLKCKNSLPLSRRTLFTSTPPSVTYCQRQPSKIKGWRRWKNSSILILKSALKAATLVISSFKSCPWAAWVIINVSIIAWRERGGGTVGSASAMSISTSSTVFFWAFHSLRKEDPMGSMRWKHNWRKENPQAPSMLKSYWWK